MSKPPLFPKLFIFLTCLVFILTAFACRQGDVLAPMLSPELAPEQATVQGIADPNFVQVLPGEKDGPRPKRAESNSATISASQGGSLSCGHVTLTFPAGALSEDTEITIIIANPSVLTAHFQPDGITFNDAVIMSWDLEGTTAEGKADITKSLWYNDLIQLWEEIESLPPPNANTTETELEHFSRYGQNVDG